MTLTKGLLNPLVRGGAVTTTGTVFRGKLVVDCAGALGDTASVDDEPPPHAVRPIDTEIANKTRIEEDLIYSFPTKCSVNEKLQSWYGLGFLRNSNLAHAIT